MKHWFRVRGFRSGLASRIHLFGRRKSGIVGDVRSGLQIGDADMIVASPADLDMIVQSCLLFDIGDVVRDKHDTIVEKKRIACIWLTSLRHQYIVHDSRDVHVDSSTPSIYEVLCKTAIEHIKLAKSTLADRHGVFIYIIWISWIPA